MRKLREIWGAYDRTNSYLGREEAAAKAGQARNQWTRRRAVNGQAFFLMLFACFEDSIAAACEALVRRMRSLPSWEQRRLWDTVDLDRMVFLRRVALLTEKGTADYQKAQQLYKTRCQIAHGASTQVGRIDLTLLYQEIQQLWRALRL